jgi:hypothetical protein
MFVRCELLKVQGRTNSTTDRICELIDIDTGEAEAEVVLEL